MMTGRIWHFIRGTGCLVAAAILFGALSANAQTYPNKPVEIIVGYSPGGLTDSIARVMAEELSQTLGQPFVVQNRAGAGGTIAAGVVASAKPDGYTLLLADHAFMTYPSLYPSLRFDTLKAFQPLSAVGGASMVFLVPAGSDVKSMKDLLALAKKNPGKVTFASGGTGTVTHLAGELFESVNNIDFLHIPYKGVSPGIQDLLGGRVSMMVSSIGAIVPQIKASKVTALAVTGPSPIDVLPGVPTVAEAGFPAATAIGYWGFFAPANMPPDVLTKLGNTLVEVTKRPKVRKILLDMGVEPIGSTPAGFGKIVREETEKWGAIIKRTGIKLE